MPPVMEAALPRPPREPDLGLDRCTLKEMLTHFSRSLIELSQQRTECPQRRGHCTHKRQEGGPSHSV